MCPGCRALPNQCRSWASSNLELRRQAGHPTLLGFETSLSSTNGEGFPLCPLAYTRRLLVLNV